MIDLVLSSQLIVEAQRLLQLEPRGYSRWYSWSHVVHENQPGLPPVPNITFKEYFIFLPLWSIEIQRHWS